MVLSNWDTLAVGLPFVKGAVTVEFYKNWLYLRDSRNPGVIARINSGNMSHGDVRILAARGPQDGIFALVESGYSNLEGWVAMAGCGVYGYAEDEFVGVSEESREFLVKMVEEELGPNLDPRSNQGDAYIADRTGVQVPGTAQNPRY